MASTETGWTRIWPNVNGYYWRRITKQDPPSLVRIVGDECRFTDGSSEGRHECYEFLGPVTVSDAEQLSELRRVAQMAATWIEQSLFDQPHDEQGDSVVASLRAALNPKQPGRAKRGPCSACGDGDVEMKYHKH